MAFSFDELCDIVKWRSGKRSDLESATDSSLNLFDKWVNQAVLELASKHRIFEVKLNFEFPSLLTYTSATDIDDGEYEQAIASDCLHVKYVWDATSDYLLEWKSFNNLLQIAGRADSDSEGPPKFWSRYGNSVWVSPTVDDSYSLVQFYRQRPATLTSASTSSGLGAEFDDLIIELATYKAFHYLRDEDGRKACVEEFRRLVIDMAGLYTEEEKARSGRSRAKVSARHMRAYKR